MKIRLAQAAATAIIAAACSTGPDVAVSAAARPEQIDDITLVPMGAARLRISAFPTSNE